MIEARSVFKAVLILCSAISPIAGAAAAESLPVSAYLHPQELVLVARERHLNLYCVGKGQPTVLFDSGLGDGTLSWRTVQGEIAKTTRACSYDRANYFFSDSIDRIATAQASVDDMLALIDRAHLGDQVILVGHSRGGLNARLFTYEHTNRVAGLVLVDATITEKLALATTSNYVHKYENYLARGQQLENCEHLARQDALQADGVDTQHCLDDFGVQHDPNEQALSHEIRSMESRPAYQATLFSERQNLFYPIDNEGDSTDGLSISQAEHSLGNLPLVVISADWFKSATFKGTPTAEQMQFLTWNADQMRTISQESTRGRFVEVASRHYVQKERPDVVIDAIRQVIDSARRSAAH
ncbi:alpha/beta hydrolase [Dyella dinghuensis]|uniref:Alpha/beta hydrolase n=1 Tax=Dyella dinghuensis TaxID=1920169 RepID=A0A3S0QYD3_9GAMM|nr:alpha/beta hydrolase [Dyella dinghuensis]RUL65855.1 alpha/beta hydrolase [Dyella dinghuensis]